MFTYLPQMRLQILFDVVSRSIWKFEGVLYPIHTFVTCSGKTEQFACDIQLVLGLSTDQQCMVYGL